MQLPDHHGCRACAGKPEFPVLRTVSCGQGNQHSLGISLAPGPSNYLWLEFEVRDSQHLWVCKADCSISARAHRNPMTLRDVLSHLAHVNQISPSSSQLVICGWCISFCYPVYNHCTIPVNSVIGLQVCGLRGWLCLDQAVCASVWASAALDWWTSRSWGLCSYKITTSIDTLKK